jgi:hypothetical protein
MGTWGTGISSNDDYADVYSEFFELYNDGKEVPEVTELVIARNSEMLSMPEAANNVWFAIAKAQWECKQLQSEIYGRVKEIIDSDADLKILADLDADQSDIEKRRKVLEKFLSKLQSERPKAKARKKRVIRDPIFKKGDCLTFKLKNGNFGGAVVLEAEYGTELGLNLVAVIRINQPEKPTLEIFKNADVMIKNFARWEDKPEIIWICNYKPKEVNSFVEILGVLKIANDYLSPEQRYRYPFTSDWKSTLIDVPGLQFDSENVNGRPKKTLKVKKLLRSSLLDRLFGK